MGTRACRHSPGMRHLGLLFSASALLFFVAGCAGRAASDAGSDDSSDALHRSCGSAPQDAGADGAGAGAACGSRGLGPCAPGLLCIFDEKAQCGALDQPGTCVDMRGFRCGTLGAGVCGCDGQTYPNACVANTAGVSVLHEGACEASAAACGSITCPTGEVCCNSSLEICTPPGGSCIQSERAPAP